MEQLPKSIINPQLILEKELVYPATGFPAILKEGKHNQCQQVGIDLRMAKAYKCTGPTELRLTGEEIRPVFQELPLHDDNLYFFKAGEQYSIDFMEAVEVPDDMAALVIHRSTINRFCGTIFSGIYDPGFRSGGSCGATFRPARDVKIQVGYRLAQIVFWSASAASLYNGQYQAKPEEAK